MNSKKTAVISAFSGIITALSFIFEDIYFIVFFSLSPTFYCISVKKTYSFTAIFFHLYSFYFFCNLWLFTVGLGFFSNKIAGTLLSVLLTALVSFILSITSSVPFLLLKKIKSDNSVFISLTVSFLYIFGEWIHTFPPISFPWNRLCNILAANPDLIQSCSLLGGLFLSMVTVLINMCTAYLYKYISEKKQLQSVYCILSAVGFFYLNIFIGNTADRIYSHKLTNPHKVLIIQPDYSREEKRTLSAEIMLEGMLSLARKNITRDTELIIFPETAVSERFFNDSLYNKAIYDFSSETNADIIFGTAYPDKNERYNACVLINPDGTVSDVYTKHILVPFGEYTPSFLPQNMQFLKKPFCKGSKSILINSNTGKIGCSICFESVFPALSRKNSLLGAELSVIITNDSWLGDSVPLYQHHSHSVIRAVENRKYTITCANTGISSVVSSDGKVISYTEKNIAQALSENIYTNDICTFYARYGDVLVIPSIAVILYLVTINVIYFLKKLAKN